jgi:hypothetical protein
MWAATQKKTMFFENRNTQCNTFGEKPENRRKNPGKTEKKRNKPEEKSVFY